MIDLDKLTDSDIDKLLNRLMPYIKKRMTNEPEETYIQSIGAGQFKEFELTTKPTENIFENPFGAEISGHIVTSIANDTVSSVRLVKNTTEKISFNTSGLGIGRKVKVLVYPKTGLNFARTTK
jgi:hypothetical protein